MSNYWAQRERDTLYNKRLGVAEKQLAKEYRRCLNGIKGQMGALYDEIMASAQDGTLLVSDLYKFNRYYELANNLNRNLNALGEKEIEIYNDNLKKMYMANSNLIDKELNLTIPIDEKAIEDTLNGVWCQDGKNWSQRVWINKAALQDRLTNGLVDCVARGVSKDEMVKALIANMGVGFNEADRIARTELNYVQNKSTYDRYTDAGIKEYEFLAEIDGRTSDICKEHDKKRYRMEDAQVGVNYPPLHPNCRSTVVAVIE